MQYALVESAVSLPLYSSLSMWTQKLQGKWGFCILAGCPQESKHFNPSDGDQDCCPPQNPRMQHSSDSLQEKSPLYMDVQSSVRPDSASQRQNSGQSSDILSPEKVGTPNSLAPHLFKFLAQSEKSSLRTQPKRYVPWCSPVPETMLRGCQLRLHLLTECQMTLTCIRDSQFPHCESWQYYCKHLI